MGKTKTKTNTPKKKAAKVQNRDVAFTLRLSPAELTEWRAAAKKERITVSQLVRTAVLAHTKKGG